METRNSTPCQTRKASIIGLDLPPTAQALEGAQKYDVIITTFGTITAHYKTLLGAEKMAEEGHHASHVQERKDLAGPLSPAAKWHRVIIDEAQNIKNPSAKSSMACCRLNATYRWCLTGTPMMNRLEDFQSLLGFLRIRPYSNPAKFKAVSTFHRSLLMLI